MSGFDIKGLSQNSLFKPRGEGIASLLSSHFTFYGLLLAAAFLSGMQLIGEPIECWCPAQITDAMCNYTKSVCWVSKQYVIDHEDAIPRDPEEREGVQRRTLQFYPMVPFILLMVALLLKLPSFLWNAFQYEEGLNITKAVQMAANNEQGDKQTGHYIAYDLNFNLKTGVHSNAYPKYLSVKKVITALGVFPMGSDVGTYQTGLFLFTRLLAIVVTVLLYLILNYVLQMNYILWGWDLIRALASDEVFERHAFPRETLCDFRVRQLQNVQDFTVQCVLPINMWSEKVFLVLWVWLLVLLLVNLYSYQYWFRKLLLPSNRQALLDKHLTILYPEDKRVRGRNVAKFALEFLSYDSVLVLRILEMAAGSRLANEVVGHLWTKYNCQLQSALPYNSGSLHDTEPMSLD